MVGGGKICRTPQNIEADESRPGPDWPRMGPEANRTFQTFRSIFSLPAGFSRHESGDIRFKSLTSLALQMRYKDCSSFPEMLEASRMDVKLAKATILFRNLASNVLEKNPHYPAVL